MQSRGSRSAVIDIGSNSVRLVVYAGHSRIPSTIFNEKILAGLGSELATTGNIGADNFDQAIGALKRFKILCEELQVSNINIIATAAVRDAHNGPQFVEAVREIDLEIKIIDGEQEAHYSALGVISAFPKQNGVVADLGGGSLELAQIMDGDIVQKISVPMGVLRVQKWFEQGYDSLFSIFQNFTQTLGWNAVPDCENLFLVGGSWRALAHIDRDETDYPLRVIDHYKIDIERSRTMDSMLEKRENENFSKSLGISSSRIKTLPQAAALMRCVSDFFDPQSIYISAFGLREGILFSKLDEATRSMDPLLVGTREFSRTQRRFHDKKSDVNLWISDIFRDDDTEMERIREAFCNLGDVAWRANPDFRAKWGLDIGLHGNWTGINGSGRDILGQALFSCFGGGSIIYPNGGGLASEQAMHRAIAWGLTVRLAQRLSGGRRGLLSRSKIALVGNENKVLQLQIERDYQDICGESVTKRLKQLADFMGYDNEIIFT